MVVPPLYKLHIPKSQSLEKRSGARDSGRCSHLNVSTVIPMGFRCEGMHVELSKHWAIGWGESAVSDYLRTQEGAGRISYVVYSPIGN